jgi:hypothetical protein
MAAIAHDAGPPGPAPQADTPDARFLSLLGRPVQHPQPLGDYLPARRVGNVVYLSTTPAKLGSTITFPGVVGRGRT